MYLKLLFKLLDGLNIVLVVRTNTPASLYLKPFAI